MQNNLSEYDSATFMLDNSGLQTFTQCERKFKLQRLLHRVALDERIATALGSAVHEVAHAHFLNDASAVSKVFAEHSLRFANGIYDIKEREETLAKFADATHQLMTQYPVVQDPQSGLNRVLDLQFQPRWIVRYPEKPFIQPLGRAQAIIGRIDCIVEDENNQMWILELKTSRHASNSIWRSQIAISTQHLTYTWVASQQLQKTLAGVIVIPVQINKRDAVITPEIVLRPSYKALENWQNNTSVLLERIEDAIAKDTFLPTGQYAGNCSNAWLGKCDFYDYCYANQPEGWIDENTRYYEWNPLAEEKVK